MSKASDDIPACQSGHINGLVTRSNLSTINSHRDSGEQSVGKSYALNHFVDTSFAGSAMRCTEGVWLSVTPTRDALVVSMDFEGMTRFPPFFNVGLYLHRFQFDRTKCPGRSIQFYFRP